MPLSVNRNWNDQLCLKQFEGKRLTHNIKSKFIYRIERIHFKSKRIKTKKKKYL